MPDSVAPRRIKMPLPALHQDTIVAVATPAGRAPRSIIRLSGPDALAYVDSIFSADCDAFQSQHRTDSTAAGSSLGGSFPANPHSATNGLQKTLISFPTYTTVGGFILLPVPAISLIGHDRTAAPQSTSNEKEKLPVPVLVYIMKAPYSYTREDVVEVHTFGAPPLLEMILDTLVELGARIAAPGEFTKRAFLHGRIDLTQAEAVMRVIRSRTDAELRTASAQLAGALSRATRDIRDHLLDLCTHVEVSIDFSDQDIELISDEAIQTRMKESLEAVQSLLTQSPPTKIPGEGVLTVITGKPNVGKSSLLNALAQQQRAIVTSIPGTTRDALEAVLTIDGITFRLVDTAGLDAPVSQDRSLGHPRLFGESAQQVETFSNRWGGSPDRAPQSDRRSPEADSPDAPDIEELAAQKSRDMLASAELTLFVLDSSVGIAEAEIELFRSISHPSKIIVLNKSDLPPAISVADARRLCDSGIDSGLPVVRTSAATNEGLERLKKEMSKAVISGGIDRSASSFILNSRHKDALRSAAAALHRSLQAAELGESWEFIALDLREALSSLGEIVGEAVTEDILDRIFSEFCIGK